MPPHRLQRRRVPGWLMRPGAVYVGRGTGPRGQWGNPFRVGVDGTAEACVALFEARYQDDPAYQAAVRRELAGKDLLCWCRPGATCHGDVLLRWANSPLPSHEETAHVS